VDAETMRRSADNCLALAAAAKDEPSRLRYSRMAAAWQALAKNKDWLDGALDRGALFQRGSREPTNDGVDG
jgi:hypothetical protein